MISALVGEGTSDQALIPILRWVLEQATPEETQVDWVDVSRLRKGPGLKGKVQAALEFHPCDVLFVHRDSDNQPPDWRHTEISEAVGSHPHVAVVPIRMTEAWLLTDETAIRAAAGRVSSKEDLGLPSPSRLESVSNPKQLLKEALISANGSTGRRARRFRPSAAVYRVADLVEDWSPLRQLTAFQRLEKDTRRVLRELGMELYP